VSNQPPAGESRGSIALVIATLVGGLALTAFCVEEANRYYHSEAKIASFVSLTD